MEPATDPDALLSRFRSSGAPRDLGELFDATSGDLYRVALATAPDAAAAEDAVQETYLTVIGAASRWDPSRRAMPWLLGILHFKVTRQREKARLPSAGAVGRDAPAPELSDGDPEDAARAWAEIERLDEPYRAVALMRWRYGLSPAEIAHVRGEAPGTTRSLLSRALDRVRKTLKVLPAGLVLMGRPARGLDAVRADVVGAATAPSTVVATGSTVGRYGFVAATIVAAIGAGAYFALQPDAPAPATPVAEAPASPRVSDLAAPPSRPLAVSAPAAVTPAGPVARGRVVDAAGKPIASAAISSVGSDSYAFERPAGLESDGPPVPPSSRTARTGLDGRFDVALDDEFPTHLLFVSAPGHGPAIAGPLRPGADVEVVLDAGESWKGRVVDATGAPVAGARVRACVVMPWFAFVREATSDATGSFRLDAMPEPQLTGRGGHATAAWLVASANGFAPSVTGGQGGQLGSGQQPVGLTITLLRGAALVGRLLDAESGAPISGAVLRFASLDMNAGWSTLDRGPKRVHADSPFGRTPIADATTDAEGRFRFGHVPCLPGPRPAPAEESADRRPWAGQLTTTIDGYAPLWLAVRQIEEGGTDTRDVRLSRAAIVKGRLVDGSGNGLAGFSGQIEIGAPTRWANSFVSDGEGRFVIRDIPAPSTGVAARIRVRGDSGSVESPVDVRGGATSDVPDVVVHIGRHADEGVKLRVRVVGPDGAPIWGAYAQFVEPVGVGSGATTDRTGRVVVSISAGRLATTELIEVAAWTTGYARSSVRKARALGQSEEFLIQLQTGRRIAGLVRLADGTPAAGAIVRAERVRAAPASPTPVDPDRPQTGTDSTGQFTFEDLPDDSFALVVTARSESGLGAVPSARLDAVRSGTTGLVIQLPPDTRGSLGRLEVSVIDDATNESLGGGYVRLRRGKDETIWAKKSPVRGRHVAGEIPLGSWNVRVFVDEYVLVVVPDVAIEATPRPGPLEVRLRKAVKRMVIVTGVPTAGPAGGSLPELSFFGADGTGATSKRDSEGKLVVTGLKAEAYRVSLGYRTDSSPGPMKAWVAEGNFVVVPAGDAPFEVRLVPAGAITLRIEDTQLAVFSAADTTDAARERSEKSSLVLVDDRQREIVRLAPLYLRSPLDITGLQLAPGRYRARLERPGEPPGQADIDIPAGSHVSQALGGR